LTPPVAAGIERLQAVPESVSSVMLVGHNPWLYDLALVLASWGADLRQLEEKFPTGALATLVVHGESWTALGPGEAELVDYVVPRQLG
jgi:phosphohistidine phosphatase